MRNKCTKPKFCLSDISDKWKCPICEIGTFKLGQIDDVTKLKGNRNFVLRDIWVERCTNCEEIIYPLSSIRYIESKIEKKYPGYFKK